jgi:peptidoglycan/xylan/chitin deacetylase (PgdA/CDA1 family)
VTDVTVAVRTGVENGARIARGALDVIFARRRRAPSTQAVLLTFDDGPHPTVTPAVLDRLAAHEARAIFFIVGSRIGKAPSMPAKVLAAGHRLGNHTHLHRLDRDPWFVPYVQDVRRCQDDIVAVTGSSPTLFRAPMGGRGLGAWVAPRVLGLRHVLWSVDSRDWTLRSAAAAAECGEALCSRVQGGDIVLFHDDNPWTPAVLDIVLPCLKARGLDLRTAVDGL